MSSDEYLALLTDSWLQQTLQKWSLPCAVLPAVFKHFMHPSPINPCREERDLHPQILLYPLIPASSHLLLPSNHHLCCLTKYTSHGSHRAPGYSEIRGWFLSSLCTGCRGQVWGWNSSCWEIQRKSTIRSGVRPVPRSVRILVSHKAEKLKQQERECICI